MVRPWRRKNCGRKITKPKISVLMVISTQLPTSMRCSSGGASSRALTSCGDRRGHRRRRQRAGRCGLLLDCLHQRFGLVGAALGLQPARRFRQVLAQIPDDQRADAGDDEHRPPAPGRDDEIAEQRRAGKPATTRNAMNDEPAAARLGGTNSVSVE